MKRSAFLFLSLAPLALAAPLACGDDDPVRGGPGGIPGGEAGSVPSYYDTEKDLPLVPTRKVDVLFVVDNSASMGDKQGILSRSVGRLFRALPVTDIHVGVISSSLGAINTCDPINPRTNDQGTLRNTSRGTTTPVPGAESGFLTLGANGIGDLAALEQATSAILIGVEENGCGLEAQLESMYRFLVQPDPPSRLVVPEAGFGLATWEGTNDTVLAQRKAFLRPDSAVLIVMLTDEDDAYFDPLGLGGRGWAFQSKTFPNSNVARGNRNQGTTAPRGTSACEGSPGSPDCVSCALCEPADSPACVKAKDDPSCKRSPTDVGVGPGYDGYHGPVEDELNVRSYRMKQRFGVEPFFPIERYVRALTNRKAPRRDTEHGGNAYTHAPTCTNPLFAAALPGASTEELCNLPEGTRSRELVFFTLIGGVPKQLVTPTPDWTKILGANPDAYDETGIDEHMRPSIDPRPGLPPPAVRGDNGTDPIHGREWDTQKKDLQLACTFALPQQRACTAGDVACNCSAELVSAPPLCDTGTTQLRGKSYPTTRELRVAKGLDQRAIVGSICAIDNIDPTYGSILEAAVARMAPSLAK